jgi:hypothetical protein
MLKKNLMLPALGILVAGSLMTGCSGCNQGDVDTAGAGAAAAENTAGTDADAHHAGDGHDGHDQGDGGSADGGSADGNGGGSGIGGSSTTMTTGWDRVYSTPAEERTGTVENLNGLRATLVAELDGVRSRLKDGTRSADDRKADQTRAAELAQGLERLDRTIKKINEADDVTWGQVRDSELKAANDFREWMAKYGMKNS